RQPTASHDITARSWIAMHLAEDLNGRTILNERRALDERGLYIHSPPTPESAHAEETLNALADIVTDLELIKTQKA
ncbi:hypothetical protein H0H93_005438, partial [Arthromyces matolae]